METHVNNSIKNMAEQRVKAICAPHLQALEKKELLDGNRDDGRDETDETVSEAWWTISAPDFHLTEPTDRLADIQMDYASLNKHKTETKHADWRLQHELN